MALAVGQGVARNMPRISASRAWRCCWAARWPTCSGCQEARRLPASARRKAPRESSPTFTMLSTNQSARLSCPGCICGRNSRFGRCPDDVVVSLDAVWHLPDEAADGAVRGGLEDALPSPGQRRPRSTHLIPGPQDQGDAGGEGRALAIPSSGSADGAASTISGSSRVRIAVA